MTSPSTQSVEDSKRFRIEVSRRHPAARSTSWASSLSAAKTRAALVRQEYERGGRGNWSDWQIIDLKDLTVVGEGTNPHYVHPAHLND